MLNFIKRHFPIIGLIAIEIVLFILNYKSGTYFLGWDNLFPEFNTTENLKRSFFAVWQEYRGVGLLDGMSFAANLPHYLFTALLSIVLPQNTIRYFFIFLMHLVGGIGVYLLSNYFLSKYSNNIKAIKIASFISALFYQFNIATVQMFYIPYEVFAVHFAFLPLLILSVLKYLDKPSRKGLFIFIILSLLSTPQAHVPTLFIVYLTALSVFLLFYLRKTGKSGLKPVLVIIGCIFITNSFWGIPYFYSAINNASNITNSKINQMATDEIYLRNKDFGDFVSVGSLLGFAINFVDAQTTTENDYMMKEWINHIVNPIWPYLAFTWFILGVIGIISIVKKKLSNLYPVTVLYIIAFAMLGNNIPGISLISDFLNKNIPFFFQIFRFTFTKFSILLVFSMSILIGTTLQFIFNRIKSASILYIFSGILLVSLTFYSLLSFQGFFIYPNLKVKIPQEYFNLASFMNTQDKNTRLAVLPQPLFWGWTYNSWGYRGSGFFWFGLPQATMDGAFYPWSQNNENYYWEMSQAIYSKNQKLFESVIKKYNLSWLILDNSIFDPYSNKSVYTDVVRELLTYSENVQFVKQYGNLNLYSVKGRNPSNKYISIEQNIPNILPVYKVNGLDQAYLEYGSYLTNNSKESSVETFVYYPFRSLFSGKLQEDLEFTVEERDDAFVFQSRIPKSMTGADLILPIVSEEEKSQKPQLYLDKELIEYNSDETNAVKLKYINNGQFEAIVSKTSLPYYYDSQLTKDLVKRESRLCQQNMPGQETQPLSETIEKLGSDILRLQSVDSGACIDFNFPDFPQKLGYLVTIRSKNIEGKPLNLWIENLNSQRADINTFLSSKDVWTDNYLVQPPMEKYGLGYTLHIDSSSIGKVKTVNDLTRLAIYPIPYNLLTGIKIVKQGQSLSNNKTEIENVEHPNPSYYQVSINNGQLINDNNYLVLSQSFDKGWKAYQGSGTLAKWFPFIFGQELKNHTLINNWANGWELTNNEDLIKKNHSIVIFYLPQLLEYLGFIIFFGGIILVLRKK